MSTLKIVHQAAGTMIQVEGGLTENTVDRAAELIHRFYEKMKPPAAKEGETGTVEVSAPSILLNGGVDG